MVVEPIERGEGVVFRLRHAALLVSVEKSTEGRERKVRLSMTILSVGGRVVVQKTGCIYASCKHLLVQGNECSCCRIEEVKTKQASIKSREAKQGRRETQ
jgi:hypothetical protein